MVFGTDGIRGKFGDELIRPDFFLKLGFAIGKWLGPGSKILIGKDTRLSGYILESSLEAGLASSGVDVYLTGPMPTPAIAYLTKSLCAQAGVVISASHNPFNDNGVKIFNELGMKIDPTQQQQIEENLNYPSGILETQNLGKAYRVHDALGRYVEYIKNQFKSLNLSGTAIALDCAHGALYQIAPTLFGELNAKLEIIGNTPNGYNINDNVGALYPDVLASLCQKKSIDLGFSFDGDGDRLVVCYQGRIIPSEYVLLLLYDFFHKIEGYSGGIVGTVLANSGLEEALKKLKIPFERTPVGDRYLASALKKNQWSLAGEPSGHYVLFDRAGTADALLCALAITIGINKYHMDFQCYEKICPLYDSSMKSFSCVNPNDLVKHPFLVKSINDLQQRYSQAKIVMRPSGTEPKVRVSIESPIEGQVADMIGQVEQLFESDSLSCLKEPIG